MTVGTLVIIVLAIIVLVVLALGFGMGWSNLWNKITGYFSPANVDATKSACAYACTTKAQYDYCSMKRDVKLADGTTISQKTCNDLVALNLVDKCTDPDMACTQTVASCKGTAKNCNEVDLGTGDVTARTAKCNAQKTINTDGITYGTCVFTPASGAVTETCKNESGYSVVACPSLKLTGATDAANKMQCEAQQGCTWI